MRLVTRIIGWGSPYKEAALWLGIFWVSFALMVLGIWLTGGLAIFLLMPFVAILLLFAGIIILLGFFHGWKNRKNIKLAMLAITMPLITVILGLLGTWPIMLVVTRSLSWASLLINQNAYLHYIQQVENGTVVINPVRPGARYTSQKFRGSRVTIDYGPPVRYAFLQPGGLLDNWGGIIYDPSHKVAAETEHLSELFGGDMMMCWHMKGAFYYCGFT
jgi:hypothetical protein